MTVFLIPKKIFLKIENLMCALRAHINRTLSNNTLDITRMILYLNCQVENKSGLS